MNDDFLAGCQAVFAVLERITEQGGGIHSRQACRDLRHYFKDPSKMANAAGNFDVEKTLLYILKDMGASLA